MKIEVSLPRENANMFMRRCGYVTEGVDQKTNELVFSRSLGASFTRFHIYCKEFPSEGGQGNRKVIFNLHLDQKRPSYKGTSAHAGEYEGTVVEIEAHRIQSLAS